jgi:hypothetical protein
MMLCGECLLRAEWLAVLAGRTFISPGYFWVFCSYAGWQLLQTHDGPCVLDAKKHPEIAVGHIGSC